MKFISAFSAVVFVSASFTGVAFSQSAQGVDRGSAHSCINPAGNERGWCKHDKRTANYRGNSYSSVISGTAIAVNGDLVQFREDSGATISLNQGVLLNSGMGLIAGGHYSLRGYWNNNMFVAQGSGGYSGNNNGYPYGGSTSIRGVITSISGSRVTLLQGLFSTVTVDDEQALNNGSAQDLFVGRSVTAYGFWSGSVFYATSIG